MDASLSTLRALLMAFAAAVAASGCAAPARQGADPVPAAAAGQGTRAESLSMQKLDGTQWRFVEVDGAAVPAAIVATIRFRPGHASGRAGCNAFGTEYSLAADGAVSFTRTLSTRMACLEPTGAMQVERGVFAALEHAGRLSIVDGQLVVFGADGRALAKLAAAPAE